MSKEYIMNNLVEVAKMLEDYELNFGKMEIDMFENPNEFLKTLQTFYKETYKSE